MGENQYVAAQIDEDSPLYQRFAEYEESQGFESRSEAVRSVLRTALEEELSDDDPAADLVDSDPNRPDGLLGGLLYDANEMKHDALLISGVFWALSSMLTLPFGLEVLFLVPALAYALTATMGWLEVARSAISPKSESDTADVGVEA